MPLIAPPQQEIEDKKTPTPAVSGKIGVLFDIDRLGGGFYGAAAYRLLFDIVGRKSFRDVRLFDGDTKATLEGADRIYCIALESDDQEFTGRAAAAVIASTDSRLKGGAERIINASLLEGEPLIFAGWIDRDGKLQNCETPWVRRSWEAIPETEPEEKLPPRDQKEIHDPRNTVDWAWDFFQEPKKK